MAILGLPLHKKNREFRSRFSRKGKYRKFYPLGRHPHWVLGRPPPVDTRPRQTLPQADGYCSGRYASYWNAFLLKICFYIGNRQTQGKFTVGKKSNKSSHLLIHKCYEFFLVFIMCNILSLSYFNM